MKELAGQVDVAHVAANYIFGTQGGRIMSGLICLGLISSISAMTWVGPRVTMTLGQDVRILSPFAAVTAGGVPWVALLAQLAIVITLILTATFEKVLNYVQFSIQLCSCLTVVGLIVLGRTEPDLPRPVRCWGYPVTPIIFICISTWIMTYQMLQQPRESLAGLATILIGALLYLISPKKRSDLYREPLMFNFGTLCPDNCPHSLGAIKLLIHQIPRYGQLSEMDRNIPPDYDICLGCDFD